MYLGCNANTARKKVKPIEVHRGTRLARFGLPSKTPPTTANQNTLSQ